MEEKEAGKVLHYYDKIGVAVVKISDEGLEHGDNIHIKGKTTDFEMVLESMQLDHKPVDKARAGEDVAIKVDGKAKEGDVVYKKA
ncbi:MAG: hypothetical protein A3G49_02805 [Candidatus Sungbacteria bacterium RIFCSPLOWO2_12_FULL_41_11]|uniref:Translation elongation factor-like protein n=1 Tax=Candidatus Sungbacteria bacterium RIFCSPLOWO2_12_FULL_41_11 TaxID=1802286 RepID=A0A1G2LR89_9BACT|nr:MAG: hypothetical protein UV01_C0001G0069 [Parcubacteria group bacterium GW2011_GWA2_42_14]OHA00262.1 MAG: hypothetical protein A3D41_01885 [Candidatus Sungbacteria bacterium RIFCSPHIGHO2_02_FULL_41_12b]OHA14146.1 MAG: hypothetical protein A3G49_02805 [Candidatus Sungbacteria bacterium RIFCSPLOWO2_12_FULL_41_11]